VGEPDRDIAIKFRAARSQAFTNPAEVIHMATASQSSPSMEKTAPIFGMGAELF
jgi:hypothetical protein